MSECSTSGRPGGEPDLAGQMAAHERLVCWVVRRQWLGPLSFGEALQAGRIGLWRALQHFDPARGTCFSTYAVPAITRAIWDAVAAATAVPAAGELPATVGVADLDPGEEFPHAPVAAVLTTLVEGLPPRLRTVVVAHHGLDGKVPQSLAALGRAWGVSRQRIHQLHVRALLLLAQPATSHELRALVGRQGRADYQRTLARQRHVARGARRGRR